MEKLKQQAILDAEKRILDFFIAIDPLRFNKKARKQFRLPDRAIDLKSKISNKKRKN